MRLPRFHLITDDAVLGDPAFAEVAEAVLARCGPAAALHLRGRATAGARLYDLGERLAGAALRSGSWLLVNDRVDIAMAVRANGVQLGRRSLPVSEARTLLGSGARIGRSVHSALESMEAEGEGADFVVMGTIFPSTSHPGGASAGLSALRGAVLRSALPVFAIGGIGEDRVRDVLGAGAHGVAVLSGVWQASDPVAAAALYLEALEQATAETVEERT
jgi:thiazole tautomerase (transcriptional regulator TenI)